SIRDAGGGERRAAAALPRPRPVDRGRRRRRAAARRARSRLRLLGCPAGDAWPRLRRVAPARAALGGPGAAKRPSTVLPALTAEEIRWVPRRLLPGLRFCEADVPVLTKLAEEPC